MAHQEQREGEEGEGEEEVFPVVFEEGDDFLVHLASIEGGGVKEKRRWCAPFLPVAPVSRVLFPELLQGGNHSSQRTVARGL